MFSSILLYVIKCSGSFKVYAFYFPSLKSTGKSGIEAYNQEDVRFSFWRKGMFSPKKYDKIIKITTTFAAVIFLN